MIRKLLPGTLALSLWLAAPAGAQTQMQLNVDARGAAMAADAKLNARYKQLTGSLARGTKALLVKAELKWIGYRDAECGFEEDEYRGGSMQPMKYWESYKALTETRTAQLGESMPGKPDASADPALNKVYQQLLANKDAAGKKLLQKAELAWLAFRDAQADYEVARFQAPRAGALARLTATHTKELATELKAESDH